MSYKRKNAKPSKRMFKKSMMSETYQRIVKHIIISGMKPQQIIMICKVNDVRKREQRLQRLHLTSFSISMKSKAARRRYRPAYHLIPKTLTSLCEECETYIINQQSK